MRLFQFAIVVTPKKKEGKDIEKPFILVDVKSVLAPDEVTARMIAAREIPDDWVDRIDEVGILTRPF